MSRYMDLVDVASACSTPVELMLSPYKLGRYQMATLTMGRGKLLVSPEYTQTFG